VVAAIVVILATAGVPVRRAAAHQCATPSLVQVGKPVAVTIGVTAEEVGVDAVTVRVPKGFELAEAVPAPGWSVRSEGGTVRYTGGVVAPFQCGQFTLHGTARRHATLTLPIELHFTDGSAKTLAGNRLGDPESGQIVFAGTDPDAAASGGVRPWQVALVVAVAVAGLAVAALVVRRALSDR
jgi:hypothetical protein